MDKAPKLEVTPVDGLDPFFKLKSTNGVEVDVELSIMLSHIVTELALLNRVIGELKAELASVKGTASNASIRKAWWEY